MLAGFGRTFRMNQQRFSAAALHALKQALQSLYWYKDDLRRFLTQCIGARTVNSLNWDAYKREIVGELMDVLSAKQDRYLSEIRKLMQEVVQFRDFSHLERVREDGPEKAADARKAVAALRALVDTHDKVANNKKGAEERAEKQNQIVARHADFRAKLDALKQSYYDLLSIATPQARGFALEPFMKDLFNLFDLDPKASFRNTGEQIDGAFTLEGTEFLFEGKWCSELISSADLDAFAAKVGRKLDNTLGLFLSINGFHDDGVRLYNQSRSVMLLMTGRDLNAVLEQRVDFVRLLSLKRRHAAQTGIILHEPFC
jgi:hypothetical protein